MAEKLTWNLYQELRRPLSAIEDKLKITQRQAKLSVKVPEIGIEIENSITCYPLQNAQQFSSTRYSKANMKTDVLTSTSLSDKPVKRPRELSLMKVPQIIFEWSRSNGSEGDNRKPPVDVRKLMWDFNEMRYVTKDKRYNKVSSHGDYKRKAISADTNSRYKWGCREVRIRPQTAAAAPHTRMPLSFDEATNEYPVRTATPAALVREQDENLNTTTPMTFQPPEKLTDKEQANKYPSQKRCAIQCERRTTQGFGGRRTPITSITFSEKEQDNDNQCESLSYEEILLTRAPLSATRINIDNEAKVNCPKDNLPGVTRTPKFRPQKQKQHYIQNKVSQATPRNTSRVNKLVRAEIKRQCTMPSYTVMKGGVGESSEQSQPTDEKKSATESVKVFERARSGGQREKNQTKPAFIPLSKRQGKKTTPSIPSVKGQIDKVDYLKFTLPIADVTGSPNTSRKKVRESIKSAPAAMRTRVIGRRDGNYVRADENKDLGGLSGIKVESPREKETFTKQHKVTRQVGLNLKARPYSERPDPGSSQFLSTMSGHHKLDINIPTAPDQSVSGFSSAILKSDMSRSDSRESIHSSLAEEQYFIPEEPEPSGPESTEQMKERIHQNLLQTLSDTEQFLIAMEQKRNNRKPQIIYSDDDEQEEAQAPGLASGQKAETVHLPMNEVQSDDEVYTSSVPEAVVETNYPYQNGVDRFLNIVHEIENDIHREDSEISQTNTQDDLSESEFLTLRDDYNDYEHNEYLQRSLQ